MLRITPLIILLTVLIALSAATPSHAQESGTNEILVLSDTNPRIDVQVEIPTGTQGSVRLELIDTSVAITNTTGEVVLSASSSAVHEIEILFQANSPAHTITLKRLPDAITGYVRVTAAPELSLTGLAYQVADVALTPDHAQVLFPLDFSLAAAGVIEIQHLENAALAQIYTADRSAVLTLHSPALEHVRIILASGSYQLQMDNIAAYPTIQAHVQAATLDQAAALMQPVAATTTTGYTTTGDAPQGTVLTVGGWNAARDWVLVGTDYGSAWMYASYLDLAGECTNPPVY